MTIRETAAALNDSEMLVKIGNYKFGDGPDFVALEIKYHHSCRKSYINQTRNLGKPEAALSTKQNTKDRLFHTSRNI